MPLLSSRESPKSKLRTWPRRRKFNEYSLLHSLKVLSNALCDIDDLEPCESWDEQPKADLKFISRSCRSVLQDLERRLDEFQELGASFKSIRLKRIPRWIWERIQWDEADISEFRSRISQNTDALNLLLTGINRCVCLFDQFQ